MLTHLRKAKPKVTPKQQEALNIFNTVSRNRRYTGQMASPLPLTENDIVQYLDLHGCNCYERDIIINIVLALDNEWLSLESARRKREAKNGN